MTDHPGSPPPDDASDPAADDDRPADPSRSERPAASTNSSTGSPTGSTGPAETDDPFAAAFAGPAWESQRRRRRSSSQAGTSGKSGSGSRERSSRGSSRRPSSGGGARRPSGRSSSGSSSRGRSRGNRRLRHASSVLVHVVLGLLGLGLAWVVVTGALAAYQLQQARTDLTSLRTAITSGGGDLAGTAGDLTAHAHHADVLTRGPAWALATRIPYLGEPFDAVRGITRETSQLVDSAAPGLVAVADDVDPRKAVKGDTVDLTAVRTAAPAVHTAALAVAQARAGVANLPTSTWLSPVDRATTQLRDQLTELGGTLQTTDKAFQVLPTMLGGDGRTRRYFVTFQNSAELRATGGLPGAFAIVTATNGTIGIERFESDTALGGVLGGVDFGAAYDKHWGPSAKSIYVSSNQSPHFPYAGQLWQSMWLQATGETVDGALTVDPSALSYLLAATGPATGPDGAPVTAANVVSLLLKDAYARYPQPGENDDRKNYILAVAEAAEKKVLSGSGSPRALLEGFAKGVSERRILAWSSDPTVQAVLGASEIGGTVPDTAEPYSQLVVNNGAAGKLDYYLGRSVTVERTGCGDTREVTVTITLTNNAPTSGLPPYVTDRVNVSAPPGFVVGQNRSVVDYVATRGAQLVSTTLDGQPSTVGVFDEEGHPSFQAFLETKPGGGTSTLVLNLLEPAGTQPVTVVKQPAVLPLDVSVDDRSCS